MIKFCLKTFHAAFWFWGGFISVLKHCIYHFISVCHSDSSSNLTCDVTTNVNCKPFSIFFSFNIFHVQFFLPSLSINLLLPCCAFHLCLLSRGQEVVLRRWNWCLCVSISRLRATHWTPSIRTNQTEIWGCVVWLGPSVRVGTAHTCILVCVCVYSFLKCTISVWAIALWIIGLVK